MDEDSQDRIEATGTVVIANLKGLHARPSHMLVTIALDFDCEIEIQCRTLRASAKSILEVLTLAASCGESLSIRAVGEGAAAAVLSLVSLVEAGFDEL